MKATSVRFVIMLLHGQNAFICFHLNCSARVNYQTKITVHLQRSCELSDQDHCPPAALV